MLSGKMKTQMLPREFYPQVAGESARATFERKKEKANLISQIGLYLCRQLEAFRRRERVSVTSGSLLPKP